MVIRATVSPVSPSSPQERRVQSRWSSSSASVRMTNSEAFVETLRVQNTQDVFGIVGSACMCAIEMGVGMSFAQPLQMHVIVLYPVVYSY